MPRDRVRRLRIRFEGTVQGVGFRPHVVRCARSLALRGFVRNAACGVVAEVEGSDAAIEAFLERVAEPAPPARIERRSATVLSLRGEPGFEIEQSELGGQPEGTLAPDLPPCDACLRELRDPTDRRHGHAFISCARCGPRFTIVRALPYDRARTTLAGFALCARCRAEYADPHDRRFHAQTVSCPQCGPRLELRDAAGRPRPGDPVRGAVAALTAGQVVALKGVGGYQLTCRADAAGPVAELRRRKHRPAKALALMVGDLEAATALVELSAEAAAWLAGAARPIVLCPRRPGAPVADTVAPGLTDLGVMLPSSPLHQLLLDALGKPLVVTSGNRRGEPLAYRDADALERLGGVADLFLLHDRPICARADDSVVRPRQSGPPMVMRRARGLAPGSLPLPVASPVPLLATGADLKNSFCLVRGRRAWPSPHVGDLGDVETEAGFEASLAHMQALLGVRPRAVAHDLHPAYRSTAWARAAEVSERIGVQHHHAHLCAVLAEHGEVGQAVGALFDGSGYGPDGTVWGGELLVGGLADVERVGSLLRVPLPGGEQAIRQPWRMALAWLAALDELTPEPPKRLEGRVAPERWRAVGATLAHRGISPLTSSVARLFDAVAALCGVCLEADYEGQAAIELEARADAEEAGGYPLELREIQEPDERPRDPSDPSLCLDPRPTLRALLDDLARGAPIGRVSARFHAALARGTALACTRIAETRGLDRVVLAGGVFQNRRLLDDVVTQLARTGLRVRVPAVLPPNDAAIAYGQAARAAWLLAQRK